MRLAKPFEIHLFYSDRTDVRLVLEWYSQADGIKRVEQSELDTKTT